MTSPQLLYPPTFVDASVVRFGDLNRLTYNTDLLAQMTLGRALDSGASTKPLCRVNLAAPQSVANNATAGTAEVIGWDVAMNDTDSMFTTAARSYVQINTAGWYWILLQVQWASGTAAARVCQISVNGTADPLNVTSSVNTTMGADGIVTQQAIAYEHLAPGAAVYGMSFQNSGAALNMLNNPVRINQGTYMAVTWADTF